MLTVRQENIMTPSDVRAIIREEMQGLAHTSNTSTRQPSRSQSPASSESDVVHRSSDESESQPSSSENEGGLCLPNSSVDSLVKSVRSTMGCPDEKGRKSAQDIMFAGLVQKKHRSFPVIPTIKELIKKEWDKQNTRGFLPSSSKRRYPFSDEELNSWSKVPKVDAAVASTSKQSVLPVEDSGVLTDPLDRKAEALLKRSWEANTGAFRPAISSTCTARSLLVWMEQLEEQIRGRTSRESILPKIPLIKEAIAFLADASVDSLRLAARSAGLLNTARRALWLKNWKGDAQARAKLCAIPCQGEFLFGKTLDELLNKAGERKKGFPNQYLPSYRRAFRRCPFTRSKLFETQRELWETKDPKQKGVGLDHQLRKVQAESRDSSNISRNPARLRKSEKLPTAFKKSDYSIRGVRGNGKPTHDTKEGYVLTGIIILMYSSCAVGSISYPPITV
ncbi:uncharacterized protein LOC143764147 [Ranitomeya variabilis]|uniref:uncharacterized protein LOC143764147 n=1 Tax=Ranitomeya variabilis TaxID=490064 RepID=UPI004056DA18